MTNRADSGGLPRMPWYPRDFRSSTLLWPLVARGVYRELLDLSWDLGGLPADPDDLREILRASLEEWKRAWPYIEPKFPIAEDGLRRNPRLEIHRKAAQRMRAGKSAGAAMTNAKRWGFQAHSESLSESDSDSHSDHLSESPPAPAPAPAPRFKSPSETRPLARTPEPRPAYERQEFHQAIIDAYLVRLPDAPRVREWSPKRRALLNARIRERCAKGKPADTIEYWEAIFEKAACSDFLTGRSGRFRMSLSWLVLPENFAKVIDGNYDNLPAAHQGGQHATA